jgi:glycosyltransferase involved in cell wall biosynthesis
MISVCIATHNGEKYIRQQLESILSQLGSNDEVIVSDDGSTDNTLSVIEGLNDKRITVYPFSQPSFTRHPHEYVCRNFQNALKHAKGDYIFLSDQDDIWLPYKVEVCLKDLENHDMVLHEFKHIDDSETVIRKRHYDGTFRPKNYFLRVGKHYGCAMAFRRSVLDYALPFPEHLLLHDYWLGILSETLGRFCYEETPLLLYRIHQANTSDTNNSLFFKIKYRIETFAWVALRVAAYKLGVHSGK